MYTSPNIIRMIKSRRMRWAWHVERMGAKRNECRILAGKPEGKRPLGRPRSRWVDNIKIDLRGMVWAGSIWLWIGTSEGSCEHGDEPSGSIKCREVPEWLHNWQLLKKGSYP
jgi:hypothetical protein